MSDISKRIEKAEKYLQKGKVESALEEYLSALDSDPGNDSVRETAADLFVKVNRQQAAATLFSELFDRQIAMGDNSKAALSFKKLARLAPPALGQVLRFAQVCERTGNQREALESYESALKGFLDEKRENEALSALRRIIALDPSAKNLKRLAELASKLHDKEAAGEALLNIGLAEEADGHIAFDWYQRAYREDPSNPDIALRYGKGLLDKGDAAAAIRSLEPVAKQKSSPADVRETYALALIAAHRPADAYPILAALFASNPARVDEMGALIGELLSTQNYAQALDLARKVEAAQDRAGKRREYITFIRDLTKAHPPDGDFLEYLIQLYNSANREHDYCDALVKLFEIRYAAGEFRRAGDALDRAADVDPYLAGLDRRLEMLRSKIDANQFRAITNRLQKVGVAEKAEEDSPEPLPEMDAEPTVLEDLMLQAEIFLQYSMRSKAVERLERIQKLFPHEEEKSDKLRQLYTSAGIVPQYTNGGASNVASDPHAEAPAMGSGNGEEAIDNFSRVTEITRNIYRQPNVKGVLFAAVNDVGRHWKASRCVAGLCNPGKPPSAALEYCAPGVKQSDVMAIVKLIGALQPISVKRGSVVIEDAMKAPELASIRQFVEALELKSLMASPLVDGEDNVGLLILEQCDHPRPWRNTDVVVAKTIADQMVLAVNNAKLRNLMKNLAVTDEKSGLLKRASYIDVVLSDVKRALQQAAASTLMLLNFGRASILSREAGEPAVEGMMQNIGQSVCANIRQTDTAVRYDKTTIALVLGDTDEKNAFFVVDKMRKVLSNIHIPGTDRPVIMNAGIAGAVIQKEYDPVDIVTEVINRVEHALEAAHAQGVNTAQSLAALVETAASA